MVQDASLDGVLPAAERPPVIRVLAILGVGVAAGLVGWPLIGPILDRPRWRRPNYRGAPLIAVGGVATVLVASTVLVGLLWWGPERLSADHGRATLFAVVGFAILGFLDDALGRTSGGGFAGHLGALIRERRLTTGLVKLVGGAVVAVAAVTMLPDDGGTLGILAVLRGAVVVALGANLLNLFDRAPARAGKVGVLWWVALLVGAQFFAPDDATLALGWSAAVIGAVIGLAPSEIREKHMQGDTGVNAAGAAVGLATVIVAVGWVEWVVLAVLAALNLSSERISFTSVIDQTAVLRWLDRLGSPYRA